MNVWEICTRWPESFRLTAVRCQCLRSSKELYQWRGIHEHLGALAQYGAPGMLLRLVDIIGRNSFATGQLAPGAMPSIRLTMM